MIKPMLACPIEIDKIESKCVGYFMEPKLDGVRCIVEKHGDRVRMYSRSGKTNFTAMLPDLVEQFRSSYDDFVLDGELGYRASSDTGSFMHTWPVIDFNKTMRVLGSDTPEALRKQDKNNGTISFYAFDVLSYHGLDYINQSQQVRSEALWRYAADYEHENIEAVASHEHWDESLYTSYVLAGGEGVILKNPDARYLPGERRRNIWFKVKKFDTLDVVVTGFTEGQGKYEGQIGAIEFGVARKELGHWGQQMFDIIGKCSGMDDATRKAISADPVAHLHRVFELRYFGKVGIDGSGLRFPQFLRWRPDKLPEECTLDG